MTEKSLTNPDEIKMLKAYFCLLLLLMLLLCHGWILMSVVFVDSCLDHPLLWPALQLL